MTPLPDKRGGLHLRELSDARPTRSLALAASDQERIAQANEALAHLLAMLHKAAAYFTEIGATGDAAVLEAHAGALARGREWPGDKITEPEWDAP